MSSHAARAARRAVTSIQFWMSALRVPRQRKDRLARSPTSRSLGELFRSDRRNGIAQAPSGPHSVWHLDEVYLKIDGRMVYLWRAVDAEGKVLDVWSV